MHRIWILPIVLLLSTLPSSAQQVPDPDFHPQSSHPAYPLNEGPVVCIDSAHNNFHTMTTGYKAYADFLRTDGYRLLDFTAKFSPESLAPCKVLIIANPIGDANANNWAYPHPSAFTREEIETLYHWLRNGNSLLLVADHSPMAGAAADLAAFLGVAMLDGYAIVDPHRPRTNTLTPDLFRLSDGSLKPHPIFTGRNESEKIETVSTFTGHAFLVSRDYAPLLVLGPNAVNVTRLVMNLRDSPQADWPAIPVAGLLQAAARRIGKGRVVILGEAATCSAQLAGPQKQPMGMNHPLAAQNSQFCSNVVRWLSGVLEP